MLFQTDACGSRLTGMGVLVLANMQGAEGEDVEWIKSRAKWAAAALIVGARLQSADP